MIVAIALIDLWMSVNGDYNSFLLWPRLNRTSRGMRQSCLR